MPYSEFADVCFVDVNNSDVLTILMLPQPQGNQ